MNTGRRARVPDGDLRDYDLACAQRHARYNACALNRALSIDRDLDLNDAFGNVCEIVGAFGRAHADYLARDHTRARILAGEIAAAVVFERRQRGVLAEHIGCGFVVEGCAEAEALADFA